MSNAVQDKIRLFSAFFQSVIHNNTLRFSVSSDIIHISGYCCGQPDFFEFWSSRKKINFLHTAQIRRIGSVWMQAVLLWAVQFQVLPSASETVVWSVVSLPKLILAIGSVLDHRCVYTKGKIHRDRNIKP